MAMIINGQVGWHSGVVTPSIPAIWTNIYAVYNADSVGSSSLKTSLYAAYNGESNANDSFGSNNGTAVGGLTYTTGKIGNAFQFNGTNAYVSLPNSSGQFNFTGSFSISGWFYITSVSGEKMIFSNSNGNLNNVNLGYAISINNSKITVAIFENTGYSSYAPSTTISTNQWYHFTVTKTPNQPPLVYLNSTLQTLTRADYGTNITSRTYNPVYTTGSYTTSTATIGVYRYNNNSTSYGLYPGNIDALNVWNKVLTQSEITELYNSGNGAQYITDNFYNPTTNDALNTYNGTAQGGLTYGVGKVGTAFQFNGTNAYVSLPDNSLNFTGDFSFSFWIYNNNMSLGVNRRYLGSSYYGGSGIYGFGWTLLRGSDNAYRFQLFNGDSNPNSLFSSNIDLIPINQWTHIAVTRKKSTQTKIYKNGVDVTSNFSYTLGNGAVNCGYNSTQYCTIGALKDNNTSIFGHINGTMDAVNFWPKELTQSEITELYNSGNGKQYPN